MVATPTVRFTSQYRIRKTESCFIPTSDTQTFIYKNISIRSFKATSDAQTFLKLKVVSILLQKYRNQRKYEVKISKF